MQLINLDDIIANASQPRKTFYEASLKELAQSIKERGVLEPIVVRPRDGKYEIVMGERRCRAATIAGLTQIPAVVREMSDDDVACDSLVENFQREDLNPVERAKAIEGVLKFMGMDTCARTLGVSESTIRRQLELLELSGPVQQALVEAWDKSGSGTFTEAHARPLKVLNDDVGTQMRIIHKINSENLSVAQTKQLVDAILQVPDKKEAFLRISLRATEEILKATGRAQNKTRPYKPQTADRHLAALSKAVDDLSNLVDPRIANFLKMEEMNQLMSSVTTLQTDLGQMRDKLRESIQKGDHGWQEVYIHCPLCGRIELLGSLRCAVCMTMLRRCLDCGNYDKMYERCSIAQQYVYMSEAEDPNETSKSCKCEDYTSRFEARKVA